MLDLSDRFFHPPRLSLFVLAMLVSLSLPGAVVAAEGGKPRPADQTYRVAGLTQPAEIIVDLWGVPHIYAGTHYDAFFVQGFNAARDRLWQIDVWRRRGLGTLAEVFGASYAEQDKAARLFLYRADMYPEWLAYGSDAKQIATSFTAGINAFINLLPTHPDMLPPEFELLDYQPALWSPADVVRIRSHGLWRNVASEVRRARIACEADLETAELWKILEPQWTTTVPEGLNPCDIPDDVLDLYLLATAPVTFPETSANRAELIAQALQKNLSRDIGSNNWVVAPSRTDTGRPILADDPHRGHAAPSLRYIAHLSAPGLNVIGAGEPALPGISIGHNERIAFGLTIFPIDQEDLYVYQKRRGGYLYQGRTEQIRSVEEIIRVRDGADQTVALRFTRHGPIVKETNRALFAIRAAWLQPGMAPYFGSVEYMRAQNWREFVAALNRWGAPSENQVYADVDGNIGYKPAGLFPRRRNWDGLLPVPGDGRYEWDGYFDMDVLPEEYNPERGFTGTANSMNLPADYPIDEQRIGFEWSAPWRYRRLWEVLEQQPNHGLIDSHDLQRDYQSVLARSVIERLPKPENDGSPVAWLKNWDGIMSENSSAAALYVVWYYRHLAPDLLAYLAPQSNPHIPSLDSLAVLDAMTLPGAEPVVLDSLGDAWQETVVLLGPDPTIWRWGDLHKIRFQHPLQHLADDSLAQDMDFAEYPRGGTGNTTNNTSFSPTDFLVRAGASFRMVLDVGRWDEAEMTNAPGQSGVPGSEFYDNLLEGWASDSSFPLLYSREAVLANQALRIELIPHR